MENKEEERRGTSTHPPNSPALGGPLAASGSSPLNSSASRLLQVPALCRDWPLCRRRSRRYAMGSFTASFASALSRSASLTPGLHNAVGASGYRVEGLGFRAGGA